MNRRLAGTRIPADFSAEYRSRIDEDLLQLWIERSELLPEAKAALQNEIARRGLSEQVATAKDRRVEDDSIDSGKGNKSDHRLAPAVAAWGPSIAWYWLRELRLRHRTKGGIPTQARVESTRLTRPVQGRGGGDYFRARYYDQNAGMFLSEDPLRFSEGSNFYSYVRNDPTILIDPTGLKVPVGVPNANKNTVVCDGKGGMRVQVNAFGPQDVFCGIYDCIVEHEENHIAWNIARNPTVCNGQMAGMRVGVTTDEEKRTTEIDAANAEIACLQKKLEKCNSSSCREAIQKRITQEGGLPKWLYQPLAGVS